MRLRLLLVVLLCLYCLLCFSCKHHNRVNPYVNNLHLDPAYLALLDKKHYTSIEWIDSIVDFGTIKSGDSVRITYHFRNSGKTPLFIEGTQISCGCTVTKYTEGPVFSGEKGFVEALYRSKDKGGSIYETINVSTNTTPASVHRLTFKGKALP